MNERCRLLQTCRRGPRRLYRGGPSSIVVDVVVSASLTRRRAPERLILLPITHRQKINVFDENLYWSVHHGQAESIREKAATRSRRRLSKPSGAWDGPDARAREWRRRAARGAS